MSTEIRLRRGTTAQHSTFTGALAEPTIDTDKKTLVVHDGVTAGGTPLARENHLHTGVYEPADPNILKVSEVGTAAFKDFGTGVGQLVEVQTGGKLPALDGSLLTNLPANPGRLIGVQVINSTATYTPTAGTSSVVVELSGPGGGGGGALAATSQAAAGGGGAGGGYVKARLTSGFSGVTVTIGTGGAGGANTGADGSAGSGASSFGAILTAGAGSGGKGMTGGTAPIATTAVGAGIGAGGTINLRANPATLGVRLSGTAAMSGHGGFNFLGNGGTNDSGAGAGSNGLGRGSGGGGAVSLSTSGFAGGNGTDGQCIIWEYA